MAAIIYLITNKENGKKYVGRTIQPLEHRWNNHVKGAKNKGDLHPMAICKAIAKHGIDAFEKSILEECEQTCIGSRETFWIEKLNTLSPNGYNMTLGGDGGRVGFKHTEETKIKQREKALVRAPMTDEVKAIISKRTAEGMAKIDPEIRKQQIEKSRLSLIGHTFNLGKKHSLERRQAQSERQKGKTRKLKYKCICKVCMKPGHFAKTCLLRNK